MLEKYQNQKIREFYNFKIKNLKQKTQNVKTYYLQRFLDFINFKSIESINRDDISFYLNESEFADLENSTKNTRLTTIKQFLKFVERDDLAEIIPKYNVKSRELDKNSLISRSDLKKLLKLCNGIREKTLIMLLYESAARRSELFNIKRSDIKFKDDYANLYLGVSKTTARNIPITESIPFLKQYFKQYNVRDELNIWGYQSDNAIYQFILRLEKRAKREAKLRKALDCHLFRHSRLTELATNRKLNEAQLRKFAGWSASSDMPATYFHLDDSDLRNELLAQQGIKKPRDKKEEKFKPIKCPKCTEKNNAFNEFCWNCGEVLSATKIREYNMLEAKIREYETRISDNQELLKKLAKKLNL